MAGFKARNTKWENPGWILVSMKMDIHCILSEFELADKYAPNKKLVIIRMVACRFQCG